MSPFAKNVFLCALLKFANNNKAVCARKFSNSADLKVYFSNFMGKGMGGVILQ